MDYKSKKLIQIIREFLGSNKNKFEINGIDLSRAVFFYREKNKKFEPIPKGNYRIQTENNNTYLNIDDVIKNKAYEYQIIYEDRIKSSNYIEEFPELKVLVRKYNELQKDVENIVEEIKTTGIKADTLKMTQILTPLEPNSFWATDKSGEITAIPLGEFNERYNEMLNSLRSNVEQLILQTKNSSISEITSFSENKLLNFTQELTKKTKEINGQFLLTQENIRNIVNSLNLKESEALNELKNLLRQKKEEAEELSRILNKAISDNAEVLKRNFNKDTERVIKEKQQFLINEVDNLLIVLQKNMEIFEEASKRNIDKYIIENRTNLKGEKGDKGDTGPRGPQGLKGENGERGERGAQGEPGKGITEILSNRDSTLTIRYNDNQEINLSIPTVKGDKGDTGPRGPKGDKGERGEQGQQGIRGEVGPKGAQGFQGPPGEKGDKGDSITQIIPLEDGTIKIIYGDEKEVITSLQGKFKYENIGTVAASTSDTVLEYEIDKYDSLAIKIFTLENDFLNLKHSFIIFSNFIKFSNQALNKRLKADNNFNYISILENRITIEKNSALTVVTGIKY